MNMTDGKLVNLRILLREIGSAALAFSGGTDSSLLLKVAKEELGDKVAAFMAVSPSIPRWEIGRALEIAKEIGVDVIEIEANELSLEEYARNDRMRCCHCKRAILRAIWAEAHARGLAAVVDGSNADDMKETRQGRIALQELGVRSPLAEVGLTKPEVRRLARDLGLSNWDKPSSACLASRVPYGTRITKELLSMIEDAEDVLRSEGFGQLRVRAHGDLARIEVPPEDLPKLLVLRDAIVPRLKTLGFRYVCLDIEGFRSGSLEI